MTSDQADHDNDGFPAEQLEEDSGALDHDPEVPAAATNPVAVHRIRKAGRFVRVTSVGEPGKRGFVLVPGIGVSSDYFERLSPHLNEFGPVHALDLPGFAGVPHPERAMSIADYAELVGAVIDDLGLGDPVVIGHSMGSQIATEVAVTRPDLSTLILIGPVVDSEARQPWRQAVAFLRCAVREPGRVKILAVSSYLLCGWRWFARILPVMMNHPLEDRIRLVGAATLIIRGEHDHVCPPAWVNRLIDALARGRAWEIPDAAHSVMYAHAASVARLCVEHVRHPDPHPYDDSVRQLGEDDDAAITEQTWGAGTRSPRLTVATVAARLLEWRGLLTRDEELVERAKLRRAELYRASHEG